MPLPLEIVFGAIGLLAVPFAMCWFVNEITSPGLAFSEIVGVPVDIQGMVDSSVPLIWIFGLIFGWRVRCWIRRQFVRRLNRLF